jgi:hypothetical protein
MALTIGPHVLSRGQLTPVKSKSRSYQTADVAGDGSVAISGSSIVERLYMMRCKIPQAEATTLTRYIENSLRFKAETVQVIDGFGVTRTMRYWDGDLDTSVGGGGFADLDLTFREEVMP